MRYSHGMTWVSLLQSDPTWMGFPFFVARLSMVFWCWLFVVRWIPCFPPRPNRLHHAKRLVALSSSFQVLFEKSEDIGGVWRGQNYAGYGAQVKREQCLRPQWSFSWWLRLSAIYSYLLSIIVWGCWNHHWCKVWKHHIYVAFQCPNGGSQWSQLRWNHGPVRKE